MLPQPTGQDRTRQERLPLPQLLTQWPYFALLMEAELDAIWVMLDTWLFTPDSITHCMTLQCCQSDSLFHTPSPTLHDVREKQS